MKTTTPIRYQVYLILLGGREQPYGRPYKTRKKAEDSIGRLTQRLDEDTETLEGFCYCRIEEVWN